MTSVRVHLYVYVCAEKEGTGEKDRGLCNSNP